MRIKSKLQYELVHQYQTLISRAPQMMLVRASRVSPCELTLAILAHLNVLVGMDQRKRCSSRSLSRSTVLECIGNRTSLEGRVCHAGARVTFDARVWPMRRQNIYLRFRVWGFGDVPTGVGKAIACLLEAERVVAERSSSLQ